MIMFNDSVINELSRISYVYKSKKFFEINNRAKQLASRGLTDEDFLVALIEYECKNGIEQPHRIKAEMYDKVNYLCRRYMDRIARFELDYDFVPDTEAMKNVIVSFLEAAPVFHSRFTDNHIAPYWLVADYNIDEVFTVSESYNFEKSADEFLLRDIDIRSNVQIKIGLFYDKKGCKLCFMWNHMIMDGGDFKRFISDFFRNYNLYVSGKAMPLDFKRGTRNYKAVYGDMEPKDRNTAKRLFSNVSANDKHHLPFSDKSAGDRKMIVRKKVSSDFFEPARKKAKTIGATVNDLLAAAYIRAFYEISGCPENERVGLSCAVDLRRYIKSIDKTGYTNHTTFMPCVVDSKGRDMTETLKKVTESTKSVKSDRYMGLHGLPLLDIGYSTMIHAQAEFIIGMFYNNAALALSNVGAIDTEMLSFSGNKPVGACVAGAAKNKPCSMMTALSVNGDLSLSICFNGNDEDNKMITEFMDAIENNILCFLNDR